MILGAEPLRRPPVAIRTSQKESRSTHNLPGGRHTAQEGRVDNSDCRSACVSAAQTRPNVSDNSNRQVLEKCMAAE